MDEQSASGPSNRDLLLALNALGSLPSTQDPASEIFDYGAFDTLLQQFTAPVSAAEATALLKLSPPTGEGAFGVEWALIHLIETLPLEKLQGVLADARANEVSETIRQRVAREP